MVSKRRDATSRYACLLMSINTDDISEVCTEIERYISLAHQVEDS
jgi:hypothetical protein